MFVLEVGDEKSHRKLGKSLPILSHLSTGNPDIDFHHSFGKKIKTVYFFLPIIKFGFSEKILNSLCLNVALLKSFPRFEYGQLSINFVTSLVFNEPVLRVNPSHLWHQMSI